MTSGPTTNDAFIDFVHDRRVVVGGVLLALALGCVVIAGYCGYYGMKGAFNKPHDPTAVDLDTPKAAPSIELDRFPHVTGMAAGLIAALGTGAVGAFFLGKMPDADPDRRRRTDRVLLLVAGYVSGLACRLGGLLLFFKWFDKLADWMNGKAGSHQTGWYPVAALLLFLVGAGITFLATLPARSEERNHVWMRRAVYAVNFALSAVLLVVGLTLVNAVVAMKLKDKLDTTSTGFYTLTDQTKAYISGLKQTVRVYAITSDRVTPRGMRLQADALRLLATCRDANPSRFEVVQLSGGDKAKLDELQEKYKSANLRDFGVLVTTGDNFERFEFVDFEKMAGRGSDNTRMSFVGEAQLVRGMMALTEKKVTAYFTQSSREPFIEAPTDPNAAALGRAAVGLRDMLDSSQCTAKAWKISPLDTDLKVPADADIVVVLDPLSPLPLNAVEAIRRFLNPSDPKVKKGKLLVFTPARPGEGGVLKTGLEQVLTEYGIIPLDRMVYTQPTPALGADQLFVQSASSEQTLKNPLALASAARMKVSSVRPIAVGEGGRGQLGASRIVIASIDPRVTWLEKAPVTPPKKAWDDLEAAGKSNNQAYIDARAVDVGTPWSVGVYAVDQESKPAVVVFGFADGLTDDTAATARTAQLLAASVDWLRERPPAPDITPKEYIEYVPRKGVTEGQMVYVPVGGTLITIVLLGLGVWAVRRK